MIPFFDFSEALKKLKEGKKVARKGWNGKGLWACLVPNDQWGIGYDVPFDDGKTGNGKRPWLALKDVDNNFGPWVPSTSDILAEDWVVVK